VSIDQEQNEESIPWNAWNAVSSLEAASKQFVCLRLGLAKKANLEISSSDKSTSVNGSSTLSASLSKKQSALLCYSRPAIRLKSIAWHAPDADSNVHQCNQPWPVRCGWTTARAILSSRLMIQPLIARQFCILS